MRGLFRSGDRVPTIKDTVNVARHAPAMNEATLVDRYGWEEAGAPCSCAYLVPEILQILTRLGPRSVLDLGCGNGALCGLLKKTGYAVAGCEYDSNGVNIARSAHPGISF